MNNIIYDDIIIVPEKYKWDYYCNFLNKLNKKDCIKLGLFCAKITANNNKENNLCIKLIEKWLIDKKSISIAKLRTATDAINTACAVTYIASAIYSANGACADWSVAYAVVYYVSDNIEIINKYLQILLRKTKQFQNNKILEQISKVDVDKLELVDWNMITDIMQEEYNIGHEFEYSDIFSRRCLIELLRREYA